MAYEPETPSEKADAEMKRRGLDQDQNDSNKYRTGNGNNGGQAEGDWIKTNGLYWEKV